MVAMDDMQSAPKNTLWEREKQLRLWDESETNSASSTPRDRQKAAIKFQDGCIFLAACSSGDTKEVVWLLGRGANINTANVDGLTALHQACIDDNLSMVRFLVEHGADIEASDNEGWTALHATASCGFVDIARYLIEKGARLDAVNNDGELAIDLAEGNKMEVLITNAMEKQGIDAEAARKEEEELMLRDTNQWLNGGCYTEQPHPKTGAMALHVAAAKGYIKVIKLLIEAGADVNARDFDGWTPLHAAAHWGQDEACKILADNFGNLSALTSAGQTPIDLADPDVEILLEELKKKQDLIKKDLEKQTKSSELIREISPGKFAPRRSSITRLSVDQKQILAQKNAEDERVHLHSVLGQVSEEVLSGVEGDSESMPEQVDSDSDSDDSQESSDASSSKDAVHEPASGETNEDKEDTESVNSNGSRPLVNGLPASATLPVEKPTKDELSNVENNVQGDGLGRPVSVVEEKTPISTGVDVSPAEQSAQTLTATAKPGVIGRQDATLGPKTTAKTTVSTAPSLVNSTSTAVVTSPSLVTPTSTSTAVVSTAQTTRGSDSPSAWRAGLRKTGSADIVCSTSSVEQNEVADNKLPRSSSLSWGSPGRTTANMEHAALRRTGSAVGSEKEMKPRVESPVVQHQQPQIPQPNDRTTDLYARYKAQLMGRIAASTPSNGIVGARPYTPTIIAPPVTSRTAASLPSVAAQQSGRQLPSVQWLRRPLEANNADQSSNTGNASSTTHGGISRRTIDLLKRDEEKEIERKARAKRARESRRSTQGVSKEDLEKAGASLQAASSSVNVDEPAPSSPVTPVADRLSSFSQDQRSLSLTDEEDPLRSYRKSRDSGSSADGSSTFTTGFMRSLRDAGLAAALASAPKVTANAPQTSATSVPKTTADNITSSSTVNSTPSTVLATSAQVRATAETSLPGNTSEDGEDGAALSAAARARRRRENRRPPGVVSFQDVKSDVSSKNSDQVDGDKGSIPTSDQSVIVRANRLPVTCLAVTGCSYSMTSSTPPLSSPGPSSEGENSFKKLYEQEQQYCEQLRGELREVRRDLLEKNTELDRIREASIGPSKICSESTSERREKRALERKISELEEELKELKTLRNENQRLRDENGALIRVISKLSK